jgi:hypothetical protein
MRSKPTAQERIRIAARCGRSLNAVNRAYKPEPIHGTTWEQVKQAAEELKLPLPPPPTRKHSGPEAA